MSIYLQIKAKVDRLDYDEANRYIDKMYNAGLLTVKELQRLDDRIFKTKLLPK